MPDKNNYLHPLARFGVLYRLVTSGTLDKPAYLQLVPRLSGLPFFYELLKKSLLVVAVFHLIFAIGLVVWAYWPAMSPATRMLALQAVILWCAGGACLRDIKGAMAKTLLVSAALLLYLLFASLSLYYDTGADLYSMTGLWLLVVIPWAIVAQTGLLWLLVLAGANIAVFLWAYKTAIPEGYVSVSAFLCLLSLLNLLCLGLYETARDAKLKTIGCGTFLRYVVLVLVFLPLVLPVYLFVMSVPAEQAGLAFWLLLGCFAGLGLFYTRIKPDLYSSAIVLMFFSVFGTGVLMRATVTHRVFSAASFGVLAVLLLAFFYGLTRLAQFLSVYVEQRQKSTLIAKGGETI